jgi:hypothetical protein
MGGLEAFGLDLLDDPDPVGDIATMEPLAFEALAEFGTKGGPIPEAKIVEVVREVPNQRWGREPLGGEQPLDAIGDPSAVGFEGEEFPVEIASILSFGAGHMDDGPDLGLPVVVADEHGQELEGIDTVRLEMTAPPFDLDGCRVDDEVEAAGIGLQKAVEPESIPAGFKAGDERCRFG